MSPWPEIQLYHSWGWGTSEVTLTSFNFSNPGGGGTPEVALTCFKFSNPEMKCSCLDYVQLLMISQAGWWTQTPSATPLQPKKWNAHFWITFKFWWSAGLVNGLKPHPPPLSSQKYEMLIFGLCSTSGDQLCNPSNKSRLKCGKKGPLSHQKMNYSFFILRSTSDDQPSDLSDKSWSKCIKWHVVSARVFCCFSLGLLLFQSGSSVCPPSTWMAR